ncbi:hypothetical protein G2W53_027208 [Senna tora]|uniref:Uncharacterized protein n=1 Tax=Senna tora TaxID=362788 RepID=A0A834TGN6_9FABA|nr:hypothetical protein G2W53_027208 [Senna tora]
MKLMSGPLTLASRNATSISERIFKRAKVSWRGHRLPPKLRSPSSPLPLVSSSPAEFDPPPAATDSPPPSAAAGSDAAAATVAGATASEEPPPPPPPNTAVDESPSIDRIGLSLCCLYLSIYLSIYDYVSSLRFFSTLNLRSSNYSS